MFAELKRLKQRTWSWDLNVPHINSHVAHVQRTEELILTINMIRTKLLHSYVACNNLQLCTTQMVLQPISTITGQQTHGNLLKQTTFKEARVFVSSILVTTKHAYPSSLYTVAIVAKQCLYLMTPGWGWGPWIRLFATSNGMLMHDARVPLTKPIAKRRARSTLGF